MVFESARCAVRAAVNRCQSVPLPPPSARFPLSSPRPSRAKRHADADSAAVPELDRCSPSTVSRQLGTDRQREPAVHLVAFIEPSDEPGADVGTPSSLVERIENESADDFRPGAGNRLVPPPRRTAAHHRIQTDVGTNVRRRSDRGVRGVDRRGEHVRSNYRAPSRRLPAGRTRPDRDEQRRRDHHASHYALTRDRHTVAP